MKPLLALTLIVISAVGGGASLALTQSPSPAESSPRLFKVSGSVDAQGLARAVSPLPTRSGSPAVSVALIGPSLEAWSLETLTTPVDDKGSFVFVGVPPGTYSTSLVGSPNTTVTVSDRDVTDIRLGMSFEAANPGGRSASISFSVDRAGPDPFFTLLLSNGAREVAIPIVPSQYGGPVYFQVPAGQWRASIPENSLPPLFKVISLTYGKIDLLKEPFQPTSPSDNNLTARFGAAPNAWFAVRGFVGGLGLNRALWSMGPKLTLTAGTPLPRTRANMTSEIKADGSFEFMHVFPGTYTLELTLPGTTLHSRTVTVTDSAVEEIDISIPRMRTITGQIVVEGSGPAPRVTYLAKGASGSLQISPIVRDTSQFQFMLPDGDRQFELLPLPRGYELVSLTAGDINLLKSPLRVAAENPELKLVLKATPGSWATIKGRVVNFDSNAVNPTLVLSCAAYGTPVSAPVRLDGSFEVRAPACGYTARMSLNGGRPSRAAWETKFIVSTTDLSGVLVAGRE